MGSFGFGGHLMRLRVDGYELGAQIGFGRLARVYAARDLATGADCAVKVLNAPDALALRAEAAAAALRDCQGEGWCIATVEAVVLADDGGAGLPALVMPLVAGVALGDWMQGERDLGAPDVAAKLRVLRGIFGAVAAVHGAGLAHNDLGFGNILVSGGHVTLLDFDRVSGAGLPVQPRDWGAGAFYDGGQGVTCCGVAHDLRALAILAALMLGGRHPFVDDPRPLLVHDWRGNSPYDQPPRWFEFDGLCGAGAMRDWLAPALTMDARASAAGLLARMPHPPAP